MYCLRHWWYTRYLGGLLLVSLSLLHAPPAFAQATYYIDESTDFTGNGCQNKDLNDVTSSLRGALDATGWSGSRFVNALAWPQDFIESCSSSFGAGGLDDIFADSR